MFSVVRTTAAKNIESETGKGSIEFKFDQNQFRNSDLLPTLGI